MTAMSSPQEHPDYVTRVEDRFGFVDVNMTCIGGANFTRRLPLLRVHLVGNVPTLYVCNVASNADAIPHPMTFWPSEIVREIRLWTPHEGRAA